MKLVIEDTFPADEASAANGFRGYDVEDGGVHLVAHLEQEGGRSIWRSSRARRMAGPTTPFSPCEASACGSPSKIEATEAARLLVRGGTND